MCSEPVSNVALQDASLINAAVKVSVSRTKSTKSKSKKLELKKVSPNCIFDMSKVRSVYVRALKPIKAKEEYLIEYGRDALRMMFGLPMPGNKRPRSESENTKLEMQAEMSRDRKEEKRRAITNELRYLKV